MIISSLTNSFFLADAGGISIIIILAIIFGLTRLFAHFKQKADDYTVNHEDGPPEDMSELIKRVLKQQGNKTSSTNNQDSSYSVKPKVKKQQIPTTPTITIESSRPKPVVQKVQPPAAAKKWKPDPIVVQHPEPPLPTYDPVPTYHTQEPIPSPIHTQVPIPSSLPFNPLTGDDINSSVERMAMEVETAAQKAMDEAYKSAETGYQKTLRQLDKLNKQALEKAEQLRSEGLTKKIDFSSKESVRSAFVMKEILDTPKGLQ